MIYSFLLGCTVCRQTPEVTPTSKCGDSKRRDKGEAGGGGGKQERRMKKRRTARDGEVNEKRPEEEDERTEEK